MLTNLRLLVFGCSHRRTTFPMTFLAGAHAPGGTHVTCLDCGLEFKYDWSAMRIGEAEMSSGYDFRQSAKQVAFCEAAAGSPAARR